MVASISYTYLGVNTFVRADYEQPDVRWDLITGSGSNPYAGLDDFGRQQNCLWRNYSGSPSDLVNLNYGFNLASSRQWREDTVAPSGHYDELYTYDDLQRLTEMERGDLNGGHTAITSPTLAQDWTLDPTGNWDAFSDTSGSLVQACDSNEGNQITDITESSGTAWATPVYDLAGNMTLMPRPASLNLSYFLVYDAWNRIRLVDVSSGAPTHTLNLMYDGLNRRVSKAATTTTHFYYSDQWQVLEERQSSVPTRQHVWGLRYVDDLILRDRDTGGGTLSERFYSLQDANWNVVALSDTSGAVQERYVYTPYGVVTFLTAAYGSRSNTSYGWTYRFTGRESDNPVGYQLNRERIYHPNLGCWLTKDPIGYDAGDVNLYRYLGSSPVNSVDPGGLLCKPETTLQRVCRTLGAGAGLGCELLVAPITILICDPTQCGDAEIRRPPPPPRKKERCAERFPGMALCEDLPQEYHYSSAAEACQDAAGAGTRPVNPRPSTDGPCTGDGGGMHFRCSNRGQFILSVSCCPCCEVAGNTVVQLMLCRSH